MGEREQKRNGLKMNYSEVGNKNILLAQNINRQVNAKTNIKSKAFVVKNILSGKKSYKNNFINQD